MHLLAIVAIIYTLYQLIKESIEPEIPAEYWANKELYNKDLMNGMSSKELSKNLKKGKYYIPKELTNAYPIPHREKDSRQRIIIENDELHKEDLKRYDCLLVKKWVEQGKYNLNQEELEIVHLKFEKKTQELYRIGKTGKLYQEYTEKIDKIDKILATKNYDCHDTEALRQWKEAYDAETRYLRTKV